MLAAVAGVTRLTWRRRAARILAALHHLIRRREHRWLRAQQSSLRKSDQLNTARARGSLTQFPRHPFSSIKQRDISNLRSARTRSSQAKRPLTADEERLVDKIGVTLGKLERASSLTRHRNYGLHRKLVREHPAWKIGAALMATVDRVHRGRERHSPPLRSPSAYWHALVVHGDLRAPAPAAPATRRSAAPPRAVERRRLPHDMLTRWASAVVAELDAKLVDAPARVVSRSRHWLSRQRSDARVVVPAGDPRPRTRWPGLNQSARPDTGGTR